MVGRKLLLSALGNPANWPDQNYRAQMCKRTWRNPNSTYIYKAQLSQNIGNPFYNYLTA